MLLFLSAMFIIMLQIVLNAEARRARQVVKVLDSDGKVLAYARPHPLVRNCVF